MANILSQRAMLMTLSLTAWSARKLDRKITDETNARHGANSDAGRYNKHLLAKETLGEIARLDAEIRAHYYAVTSPWLDREGTRILSSVHAVSELQWFKSKRYEREDAVSRFVSGYPAFVDAAKIRLNGMFNESDYPPASIIAGKFRFAVSCDNIPDSDDFRVAMADGQAEDIKREIEARSNAAVETVIRDCYSRIAEVVGRMSERLKAYKPGVRSRGSVGPMSDDIHDDYVNPRGTAHSPERTEGIFRDSLVENVRDLVALLPALNITGDAALSQIAARMKALTMEDASALRDNVQARETVARDADAILADVQAFLA